MFCPPRRLFALSALSALCCGALLAGCNGRSVRSPASKTVTRTHDSVLRQDQLLLHNEYSPVSEFSAVMPDGAVLRSYTSLCKGSADGHCQAVDVFVGAGVHRVLHRSYTTVQSVQARSGQIVITSRGFAPSDPLCCPTGHSKIEVWKWVGNKLVKVL